MQKLMSASTKTSIHLLLKYIAFDEALLLLQHAGNMLGAKRHGEMIKTWIYISCLLSSSMTTWADSHTSELSTAWNISTPAGWSGTGILLSSAALDNLLLLVTVEGPNTDLPEVTLYHFQRCTVSQTLLHSGMEISSRYMPGISTSACFEKTQDMIQQWDWVTCYFITHSQQVLSKFPHTCHN